MLILVGDEDCLANHYSILVLAANLTKVTAVVGLLGWTAVSLAVGALIVLVHCSR